MDIHTRLTGTPSSLRQTHAVDGMTEQDLRTPGMIDVISFRDN